MTASAMIPADPELMRIDSDGPTLLGSRCPQCDRQFFPRRWECPVDLAPLENIDLPRQGHLHVATYVHTPAYGRAQMDAVGYGVGQIDLEGGVRVQSVLSGKPADWSADGLFVLDMEPIAQNDDGAQIVIMRFRPAVSEAASA